MICQFGNEPILALYSYYTHIFGTYRYFLHNAVEALKDINGQIIIPLVSYLSSQALPPVSIFPLMKMYSCAELYPVIYSKLIYYNTNPEYEVSLSVTRN